MNKDEKTIEYLIAHKNNLWTSLIVLTGGLTGILLTFNYSLHFLFTLKGIIEILLFSLGVFLFVLMLNGVINTSSDIKKFLK